MPTLPVLVFIGLAGATVNGGAGRLSRFDRDGSFYPTVLAVIAFLYVLLGVEAGAAPIVAAEQAVALAFATVAIVTYRRGSAALLAAGLAAHRLWDLAHDRALPA